MADRRCLKPKEYAAERRIDLKTMYRLLKTGKVPAERVGHQWRIWLGPKPAPKDPQNRTT